MFPKEGAVISHHPSRNPALLVSLAAGRTYYFIVRGADRSGNQAQSGEYQVKVQTKTYLPLIRRR